MDDGDGTGTGAEQVAAMTVVALRGELSGEAEEEEEGSRPGDGRCVCGIVREVWGSSDEGPEACCVVGWEAAWCGCAVGAGLLCPDVLGLGGVLDLDDGKMAGRMMLRTSASVVGWPEGRVDGMGREVEVTFDHMEGARPERKKE